jgi:uncharacterized Zn finger protein
MIRADFFRELTWADLIVWAGKDIVTSGRKIQLENRVKQLSMTQTNGLLAWVEVDDVYATRVEFDGTEFISECSCNPVEHTCDHSIAVIIDYIICIKRKIMIPTAKPNDRRYFLL